MASYRHVTSCIVIETLVVAYRCIHYVYVYIYIYTRNAWALPRRSLEVSHSQTNGNDVETLPAYGKYN